MVAGEFGKKAITEIVFSCRVFPIVSFECADEILRVVRPEAGLFGVVIQIMLKGLVAFTWHGQVAGQNIVQRWNIGRALDGSMTAQRENSAARPADVA